MARRAGNWSFDPPENPGMYLVASKEGKLGVARIHELADGTLLMDHPTRRASVLMPEVRPVKGWIWFMAPLALPSIHRETWGW